MRQEQAANIVRAMFVGAQKARSISAENGIPEHLLAISSPWLYGKWCCLPMLAEVVDKLDAGEELSPITFLNLLHIAAVTPSIALCTLSLTGQSIPQLGVDIELEDFLPTWEV